MNMVAILVMWHKPFVSTFIPPSHGSSTCNLASISLAVSKEKKYENVWIWMTFDKGQWMTLTFHFHTGSWNHLVKSNYQLLISQTTIVSEKSIVLPFYPYKSIRDQIWHCRKKGQCQPRVIIWTNLVVLKHPMLHTNFQGHRPFGSEEDFLRLLP